MSQHIVFILPNVSIREFNLFEINFLFIGVIYSLENTVIKYGNAIMSNGYLYPSNSTLEANIFVRELRGTDLGNILWTESIFARFKLPVLIFRPSYQNVRGLLFILPLITYSWAWQLHSIEVGIVQMYLTAFLSPSHFLIKSSSWNTTGATVLIPLVIQQQR